MINFGELKVGKLYVWDQKHPVNRKFFVSNITDFKSINECVSGSSFSIVKDDLVVLLGVKSLDVKLWGVVTYWIRVLLKDQVGWIQFNSYEWKEAKGRVKKIRS